MAIVVIILPPMEETGRNKRIQFWVGLAISLACLVAIFIMVDPAEVLDAAREARYGFWLLALVSLIFFMVFRAMRWRFMLNAGSVSEGSVPYKTVFHIQNIGYFLTYILPLRLGDIARAILIGNVPPLSISRGLSTMVAERVLDLLFMVILFPVTITSIGELPPEVNAAVQVATILAITAAIVLIIAANRRELALRVAASLFDRIPFLDRTAWTQRLAELLTGLNVLTRVGDAILLVLLSILVWLPIIAGYYVGLRGVNLDVSWVEAAFVVCISAFTLSVPSTPGGVGPQDAGITFAVSSILGYAGGAAVTFAFLYRIINYIVLGILAVIGVNLTGETFGSVIASTRAFVRNRSQ
jgi:uncharacterized protein (TIRG00374 family)